MREAEEQKKSIFIKDLRNNDLVLSTFMVRSRNLFTNRKGEPCLVLQLGDNSGVIEGRLWGEAERVFESATDGKVVSVMGKVHETAGRKQIALQHVVDVEPNAIEWDDYVPKATFDLEESYRALVEIFEKVENEWIRELSLRLLRDPEIANRYPRCPAAKSIHHAKVGGLLAHVHQLIRVVDAIAPLYPFLNRELLVFGAAFHDFGKVVELSFDGPTEYTDEGKLLGHITIGQTRIDREIREMPGFPKELELLLKHIILAHHGRVEYGSPKPPQTLEALVVAALDDLDSKIDSISNWIKNDPGRGRWTSLHKAYGISYYRSDTLIKALKETPT